METMMKNKAVLLDEIQKCSKKPMNRERAAYLSMCRGAYKAVCMAMESGEHHGQEHSMDREEKAVLTRQMAETWARGMVNADGTRGPHWSMAQTQDVQIQHKTDCDPVLFWVVMNSIYSDYCEALKKNNASTLEMYVCLTKAWLKDADSVSDKAAAYYTHIVAH